MERIEEKVREGIYKHRK